MIDAYLGYKPNPYRAFPIELRGNYCEVKGCDADSLGVISIEARATKSVIDEDQDDPYGWKKRMGNSIDDASPWIYKLEYFDVKSEDIRFDEKWNVADHAKNYKEYFFFSFRELVDFILAQWGVRLSEFKHDYEISIPLG